MLLLAIKRKLVVPLVRGTPCHSLYTQRKLLSGELGRGSLHNAFTFCSSKSETLGYMNALDCMWVGEGATSVNCYS